MRLAIFFVLLSAIEIFAADTQTPNPEAQSAALYAWFDQLPLPDVTNCPFIRIWTGGGTDTPSGKQRFGGINGFLLKDEGASFTAVLQDFTTAKFRKSRSGPEFVDFVGYRVESLKDEVQRLLPTLGKKDAEPVVVDEHRSDRLGRIGELFGLARICQQRGQPELARAILAKLPQIRQRMPNGRPDESFQEILEADFAGLLDWITLRDFANAERTRSDLVGELKKIEQLCPKAELSLKRIRLYRIKLENQLAEDAIHRMISDAELSALPPEKQAEELVYRLRDETTRWKNDGADFDDAHEFLASIGAYSSLVSLGIAAVPALVAALDSDGLTRSVVVTRDLGGGVEIVPIHDMSLDAICDIAGIKFPSMVKDSNLTTEAEREKRTRNEIGEWFEAVSTIGEKAYLLEKVRSGLGPGFAASRLLNKYPPDGLKAVLEILPKTNDSERRNELIMLLMDHDTPESREALTAEMMQSPAYANRVTAAHLLLHFGVNTPIPVMRTEWAKVLPELESAKPNIYFEHPSGDSPTDILKFIVWTSPYDLRSAIGNATGLPAPWKAYLIKLIAESSMFKDEATQAESQDVLAELLNDTASCPDTYGFSTYEPPDPRVCDLAAELLHECWPHKYEFHVDAPAAMRFRECVVCANVRARELGEPLRDVPPKARPEKRLAAAHACDITSINWNPDSATLPPVWRARFSKMQGARMSAKSLVSTLCEFVKNSPDGIKGLKLELIRLNDLSGVKLSVSLETGSPATSTQCIYSMAARLFLEEIGSERANIIKPEGWKSFSDAVKYHNHTPPETAFKITARISLE